MYLVLRTYREVEGTVCGALPCAVVHLETDLSLRWHSMMLQAQQASRQWGTAVTLVGQDPTPAFFAHPPVLSGTLAAAYTRGYCLVAAYPFAAGVTTAPAPPLRLASVDIRVRPQDISWWYSTVPGDAPTSTYHLTWADLVALRPALERQETEPSRIGSPHHPTAG